MPLLQIQTSANAGSRGAPAGLLKALSADLARELGKPESYVMVAFESDAELLFGGTSEPACFAALKNIGTFTPSQTERLSALVTQHLSKALGVAPSRIYIEFVNAQGHLWATTAARSPDPLTPAVHPSTFVLPVLAGTTFPSAERPRKIGVVSPNRSERHHRRRDTPNQTRSQTESPD